MSRRVELSFAVHKFGTSIEIHQGNNTLGLKYYANINDAPVTDLLIQASIKTDNHLMNFLILVGKIVQTLEEVQEHTLSFIKMGQLTMAHMFQDRLINQVQKVSTIQHAMQGWLYHISGC